MKKFERRPLRSYWQPRYWPTWLAIGFLRATCLLPYPMQMRLGKAIGRKSEMGSLSSISKHWVARSWSGRWADGHRQINFGPSPG